MVELLKLDCLGHPLVLEGSMAGWQQLFLGDTVVSQLAASAKVLHCAPAQHHLLAAIFSISNSANNGERNCLKPEI